MTTSPACPAFTTYAPAPWQAALIRITRTLRETWVGRRLALWLRKPVLLALKDQPCDMDVLGAKMRLYPFDNVSEKRVLFTPQFFDAAEIALLKTRFHDGFQFVDVGANAGIYSLYVAAHTGPSAKIVAIEPQPEMLRRLRQNIALNDFSHIHLAACAVGDPDTPNATITLHLSATNRGGASVATTEGAGVDVPYRSLLSVFDEAGITQPDALKIDIEGAEDIALGAFFRDAPKGRWPKVLFMERNQSRWHTDVLSLCLSNGYKELTPGRMNVILELDANAK